MTVYFLTREKDHFLVNVTEAYWYADIPHTWIGRGADGVWRIFPDVLSCEPWGPLSDDDPDLKLMMEIIADALTPAGRP